MVKLIFALVRSLFMRYLVSIMFIIVSIIHLLPVIGVLSNLHLERLYGLRVTESNLSILLRHRAVLFGIVGFLLLYAAFRPQFQPLAFFVGFTSVVSFLFLAWTSETYNQNLARVVTVDIVALICLVVALVAYYILQLNS